MIGTNTNKPRLCRPLTILKLETLYGDLEMPKIMGPWEVDYPYQQEFAHLNRSNPSPDSKCV